LEQLFGNYQEAAYLGKYASLQLDDVFLGEQLSRLRDPSGQTRVVHALADLLLDLVNGVLKSWKRVCSLSNQF
jgi:hypothetical protein